jgi:predicted class III extradiol MEMO1 family dioxygenase
MVMDLRNKDYKKIESFIIIGTDVFNYYSGKKMGVLQKKEYPSTPLGIINAMKPIVEEIKKVEEVIEEEPEKLSVAAVSFTRRRGRPPKDS